MRVVSCRGSEATLDPEHWLEQGCGGWRRLVPKTLPGLWGGGPWGQAPSLSGAMVKTTFVPSLEASDWTCSLHRWGNKTQQGEISFLIILAANERQNQT